MRDFSKLNGKALVAAFNAMASQVGVKTVNRFATQQEGVTRCKTLSQRVDRHLAEIEAKNPAAAGTAAVKLDDALNDAEKAMMTKPVVSTDDAIRAATVVRGTTSPAPRANEDAKIVASAIAKGAKVTKISDKGAKSTPAKSAPASAKPTKSDDAPVVKTGSKAEALLRVASTFKGDFRRKDLVEGLAKANFAGTLSGVLKKLVASGKLKIVGDGPTYKLAA